MSFNEISFSGDHEMFCKVKKFVGVLNFLVLILQGQREWNILLFISFDYILIKKYYFVLNNFY